VKAIADTGFLVAFRNARYRHHQWARGAENITEPLLVCEAVLAETAYRLDIVRALASWKKEWYVWRSRLPTIWPRLKELPVRYQDRKAGLGGSVPDPDERDLPEAPDDHDGRDGLSHLPAGPAGGDPASAPVERPTGVSVVAAKSAGAEVGRRVGFRGGGGRERLGREVTLSRLAAK
jgi:hypothetical protein